LCRKEKGNRERKDPRKDGGKSEDRRRRKLR
jgi:hypothetical protein